MTVARAVGEPVGFSVDHLDRSVDPGRDFYEFATGTWRKEHPVPADQTRWGSFSELRHRNRQQLRAIAEWARETYVGSSNPVVREVGTFYASALDRERRNALRFGPVAEQLASVDRLASTGDLGRTLAALHDAGFPGMFETEVDSDITDSSTYAFYVGQGGLSLPDREYYLAEAFAGQREEYRAHVARMFALAGDPAEVARASAEIVIRLETELSRASRTRAEIREVEKNYHRFTVEELLARYPSFPWTEYLAPRRAGVAGHLVVRQPEFFAALESLVSSVRLEEWKAYLRWHILHAAAPSLHEAADLEDFAYFRRRLMGQADPEPDWERAVESTDESLGEALGQLYVDRHFPPEARQRMGVMVDDLCAVFRERLARLDWMTEATRQRALEKFSRFVPMIGRPERYRDYSSIELHPDRYAANVLRARAFEVRRRMARIGGPVDREEWFMTPPAVNAYNNPNQNQIVFPAGILQPPFFDVTMDDAVNYGSIGGVIGHEITHGFDDQGRKFDARGNLSDWWTDADAREFDARAARIEEEYGRLEALPGMRVNGKLTLGENIADIGGVSIAFEALQRRLSADPSRARTIDGFTPTQRFCLAWAQVWKDNIREDELRRRLTIDPHAPARFRGAIPLTHLPEFFEAFPSASTSEIGRSDLSRVRIW